MRFIRARIPAPREHSISSFCACPASLVKESTKGYGSQTFSHPVLIWSERKFRSRKMSRMIGYVVKDGVYKGISEILCCLAVYTEYRTSSQEKRRLWVLWGQRSSPPLNLSTRLGNRPVSKSIAGYKASCPWSMVGCLTCLRSSKPQDFFICR